uniref:Chemokine interleukin-8-like domain-containing protein n=1 Tax=Electrophorus electricus TaxID=8005 RepID=A0A4W4ET79_ELEEL
MHTNTAVMRSLAIIVIIAFTAWTITDAQKINPCCVKVCTAKVKEPIIGYTLQRENLSCIRAVVFQTESGFFCIDPQQPWVKEKVMELRLAQKNKLSPSSPSSPSSSSPSRPVSPCLITSTVRDAQKINPCCVKVSTAKVKEPIIGYTLQRENLPCIRAVVFQTESGFFCIDPQQPWVKEKVMELRLAQKNKLSPSSPSSPSSSSPSRPVSPRLITSTVRG